MDQDRTGPWAGVGDEITAKIDAVLANYDEGGFGWSREAGVEWPPQAPAFTVEESHLDGDVRVIERARLG